MCICMMITFGQLGETKNKGSPLGNCPNNKTSPSLNYTSLTAEESQSLHCLVSPALQLGYIKQRNKKYSYKVLCFINASENKTKTPNVLDSQETITTDITTADKT